MLKLLVCSGAPEQALRLRGFRSIAGVDEVGRGWLFGPVVAAAVILPEDLDTLARAGLKDSKQLTRPQRESLDRLIRSTALAISIAEIDAATIDRVNIYQATRLAMLSAVRALAIAPDHLLIDAMQLDLSGLAHPCAQTRLIYGDALSLSIAAASVVAKVHRDRLMLRARRRASRLRPRRAQGIRHRAAPPRPHRPRPHPPPPPLLRPRQSHRPPTFHKTSSPSLTAHSS